MTALYLSKTKIETKLAIIRESLTELEKLSQLDQKVFIDDRRNFAVAEHYLRRALEAIFDIAGHIISRYTYSPGKRPSTYKELAEALADKEIIDEKFGKEVLTKMAGYRNRLTHFYDEVTQEEMYEIISNELDDIETFAKAAVNLLKDPGKFDLEIEE